MYLSGSETVMSSVLIELSKGPRLKGAMVCWLRVCETVIKSINMKCCVDLTHFAQRPNRVFRALDK